MTAVVLVLAVLASAVPSPEPTISPSSAQESGTATWYCSTSSSCTRGYGPSDLVAAIDRKDTPWDKGDRLLVTSGGRSVVVTVVDVCACKGRRIIDLTSGAFRRLASLGRGVIPVTITDASAIELPATDAE